jgi:hypothetical protein
MPEQYLSETPLPLFGSKRYVLDRKKAVKEGYRIFRATHSCGCCHVEMAFLTEHNARLQFDMPKFADMVRDDMGVIHECINTTRGFQEIIPRRKVIARAVKRPRPLPNVPQSTGGAGDQPSSSV